MDWFLYDNGLRHERVKGEFSVKLITCLDHEKAHGHVLYTLFIENV